MKLASEKDTQNMIKEFGKELIKTSEDTLFMVVKDGENLLGFATVELASLDFAVIRDLYIVPEERGMGLGDGLLRSTFNMIDLKGIRWVLIEGKEELRGLLNHEELPLLQAENLPSELKEVLTQFTHATFKENQYYYCEPKEFFSRKCKGSKRMGR